MQKAYADRRLVFRNRWRYLAHSRRYRYANNPEPVQKKDDRVHGVDLMPSYTEVDRRRTFVVIIVIIYAQHQDIDRK